MAVSNVDLQVISQKASELKTKANDMFDILNRAKKVVDETEQHFRSGEGDELRAQFASYSTKFQPFQEDVTAFGTHADDFAKQFGGVQSKLKNIAQQLPKVR